MKTQITKTLTLTDDIYTSDKRYALCGSFVQEFFPEQPLPAKVQVTVSTRCWAYKGAKRIWIRHQRLGHTGPSSWTWDKTETVPSGYIDGGGMFIIAKEAVAALLGDKLKTLPAYGHTDVAIPLYVRVVKAV